MTESENDDREANHCDTFYDSIYNVVLYALSFISLVLSIAFRVQWPIFCILIVYFFWDLLFVLRAGNFSGRKPEFVLEQISNARTTMSYFLAFQAIIISALITSDSAGMIIKSIVVNSELSKVFIVMPVICSVVSMLFIPVKVSTYHESLLSKSVRAMFFIIMYFQKIVILTTVFDLIWVVNFNSQLF